MSRFSSVAAACAVASLAMVSIARAENGPIIRDCSLVAPPPPAVDPDFVLLSGTTLKIRSGVLSVLPTEHSLVLTASESVDNGDSAGTVQLFASAKSGRMQGPGFFGTSPGFVILNIPLANPTVGKVYTISWTATFDNGQHACPGTLTPENTTPIPFVVTVVPK